MRRFGILLASAALGAAVAASGPALAFGVRIVTPLSSAGE